MRPAPWPDLMPDAPAALRRLLSPADGPLLAPVRSEIFGPQRFAQHGRSLGLTHAARRPALGGTSFFPRLRSNIAMLRQARQAIAGHSADGRDVSPAALWLLDNFHLIEAQLPAIREGLPRSYFRALPVLLGEPLAGLPRIYGVAWAFVAHTDSGFDEAALVNFLQAYQTTRPLNLSEMWALPTTLRVVLVENLRRLAERLATQKAAREAANLCCDRIRTLPVPTLQHLLALAEQRGVGAAFLAQIGGRLQDRANGPGEQAPAAVRQWLADVLPNLAGLMALQAVEQTADNVSVSNAVASLRAIGDADWPELIAGSSLPVQVMLGAPLFAAEHAGTRDQTLHGIEALARRSGRSGGQVGRALVELMTGPARPPQPADGGDSAIHGAGLAGLSGLAGLAPDAPWDRTAAAGTAAPGAADAVDNALGTSALGTSGQGADDITPDDLGADDLGGPWPGRDPADGQDPQVASYWLHGPGRAALYRRLGLHTGWWLASLPTRQRLRLPLYMLTVLLGTLALVAALLHGQWGRALPLSGWGWALSLLLLLWPASEAVIALLHRLISESARPRGLPRLALAEGIPPEHRVMVVVPAMLTDSAAIDALVHRLHLHHLANPEAEAQFALLTDWPDADALRTDTDHALLAHACRRVSDLNAALAPAPVAGPCPEPALWPAGRTADGAPSTVPPATVPLATVPPAAGSPLRFVLLHRQRRYSRSEERWIGWERKRGKLEQLVALLADGAQPLPGAPRSFVDLGALSTPALGTRHIVTLDSDTQLPPGRLRALVGVAAHPANRPRLSADHRRVVAGYGMLQPRLVTPLPAPAEDTLFHRLFAGRSGIDPYSAASSEVYQDLFGEGSYCGKGLLDVQAVHAVLSGRLPEGLVLSHDLLEGALARCGAVTDIELIEDAPFHADVAASRVHRWTRGDWQLLPILLRSVAQPRRYPLGALNRWKMADNLRRSLVAPMSLALLVLALADASVGLPAALGLVLAAFAAGPLLGALAGLVPHQAGLAWRRFYSLAGAELLLAIGGGLWHLAMLLQQAMAAVDAIVRALHRLVVSQRHLLQWTTAAAAQAAARQDLRSALRQHWPVPVVAAGLLAGLGWAGRAGLVGHPAGSAAPAGPGWLSGLAAPFDGLSLPAVLLCMLWAASPLWSWLVSRRGLGRQPQVCPPADAGLLRGIARDTWRYFERTVTADDLHLPPDNLQTAPHELLAHRTSPTNIGLYLLAAACARQFGWLDNAQLLQRLTDTLGTLDTLARHRGHFYNWYDTQTGQPLLPMYVSTVDSGNLSGHLLAVAQACLELAAAEPDAALAQRLKDAARRCDTLAWQADFACLYHPGRHLLHIGLRVAEQQLDRSFYDLLASEARLTSLLAIAKGDVPVRHWAALGRPFLAVGAAAGLSSWSGSMFEYLMPTLVLVAPHGSVLRGAGRAALVEQQAFGRARGVPWGVSESAYAGRDHTLAYQYARQGVPRLALRRTPADELVVAPYATALAAQLDPHAAALNFAALQKLGGRGDLGFIEALDFTPARQTGSEGLTLVQASMAHHQGMTVVALANVLLGGVAQRWGMANPRIEAVASLLHERAPREVPSRQPLPPGPLPTTQRRRTPTLLRRLRPGQLAVEPTHLLSNGRFSVALRANGAGHSRWGRHDLSRWRDDALRDAHGSFFWLRRGDHAAPVSLTQHPAPDPEADYHASFHADSVGFDTRWPDLRSRITVWVSPEDDIAFSRVELHNLGDRPLTLQLMSAFEVALADARADEAHPAFGKLFVAARALSGAPALVFERRPRLAGEPSLHLAHFLADSQPPVDRVAFQTDRQRWLGRNRAASRPRAALLPWPADTGTDQALDTGLDPMGVLAASLHLAPGAKASLTFATAASDNAATLLAVVDKHRQASQVDRSALMSATLASIRLRALGLDTDSHGALQALTTALLFSLSRPMGLAPGSGGLGLGAASMATNPGDANTATPAPGPAFDNRLLWRFGLSGERPLLLVSVSTLQGLGLVRALGQALLLWSWGGVACDLVVVNAEPASYLMPLQHELAALRDRHVGDASARAGQADSGWQLLRADELSAAELATLQAVARVRLLADGRSLAHHLHEWAEWHEQALQARQAGDSAPLQPAPHQVLEATVPAGQFGDAASHPGEFAVVVSSLKRPQRPWLNVLANPQFGSHVTEAGGGCSWAINSRLNQLTPWSNDPVADPPSEWLLLQDRRTRQVWSATPSAWAVPGTAYHVVHGQGFTRMRHRRGDLEVQLCWTVDADTALRQLQVQLVNLGSRTLQLRLLGLHEWQLGGQRSDRSSIHTSLLRQRLVQGKLTALLATQQQQAGGFGGGTAFLALAASDGARPGGGFDGGLPASDSGDTNDDIDWTCDRRECFDARGHPVLPDHLGQRQGSGLDPCAALALSLDLAPGASTERVLLMGWAPSLAQARVLAVQAAAVAAPQRLQAVQQAWQARLGAVQVRTPDPLFDALVNHWLLYQAVACRLWAKAGFYQAGGATGFRDQLQDSMALAFVDPAMLRVQIQRCAARQFAAGDVQHWWHAPGGAGVRTHFSDDLLWLPYALAHHQRHTGDVSLLDEAVPFLADMAIPDGAEDIYGTPAISPDSASLYEHAARAIDRSLAVGAHGLPLMGSGDWNDGMNRVGHGGRGESVWLGWFLCRVVADFGPLARQRGEHARAQRWDDAANGWREALDGPAWDGQWYIRAFFDDGQPLGSQTNAEARIDLIAQAWAVLSGAAPPQRQQQAMAALQAHLVDASAGLLRLLDPPLATSEPSPGYISAYPPGMRENGGQYSHAAVWAVMAQAQLAKTLPQPGPALDLAWQYFRDISPAHRAATPSQSAAYGVEPYVVAGDVYSAAPYVGCGGWSWYTGAAAWLHRAAIESILGLDIDATSLRFHPGLPSHWPRAELALRRDGRLMRFLLLRADAGDALASAGDWGAADRAAGHATRLLLPGESLAWPALADEVCFVVPLGAVGVVTGVRHQPR